MIIFSFSDYLSPNFTYNINVLFRSDVLDLKRERSLERLVIDQEESKRINSMYQDVVQNISKVKNFYHSI